MITVLLDGDIPTGIFGRTGYNGKEFFYPDRAVFYHTGPVPVFVFHYYRAIRYRGFKGDLFAPDPSLFFPGIGFEVKINDSLLYRGKDVRQCLRSDIAAE